MNEEGRRKSPGVIDSRSDPQAVVANTWVTPSSLMADMENNHSGVFTWVPRCWLCSWPPPGAQSEKPHAWWQWKLDIIQLCKTQKVGFVDRTSYSWDTLKCHRCATDKRTTKKGRWATQSKDSAHRHSVHWTLHWRLSFLNGSRMKRYLAKRTTSTPPKLPVTTLASPHCELTWWTNKGKSINWWKMKIKDNETNHALISCAFSSSSSL